MGIFPYKTKKSFGVILETWTPSRKTQKLEPSNYPTYNLNEHMTYEQAKDISRDYNKAERLKKQKEASLTLEIQSNSYLNDKSLPKLLVQEFENELTKEYKGNEERLETILQHWLACKKLLNRTKIDYTEFFDKRFIIFDYYGKEYHTVKNKKKKAYSKKPWSADYIKRITKMLNKWGSFCARRRRTFFEPIPKIGIRFNQIAETRRTTPDIREPATPLNWTVLNNLKTKFEHEKLKHQWNWLFIGLFFGLRPSEIENLKKSNQPNKKEKFYKIEYDSINKINVLFIYQNKLKNLPENRRWKIIPVFEPEQVEALKLIQSGEFKKPLNKTLKRLFEIDGIGAYSPRKGMTDLFLSRNYQLEDIATFLGHSSIETTWRHYKNKFAYKLPEKTERHLKAVPGGK